MTNSATNSTTSLIVQRTQKNWLLPDGVTDVLFEEAQKQESLRDALLFVLTAHGYQLVSPPLIEYTDSLLDNADEDLKRQTFKFVDQLNGRLMGLRADITPQILRIDSKYGKGVSRYCYVGQVVKTLPTDLFGLRTPLQLGAEIFGIDSVDAEIALIDLLSALVGEVGLECQALHIDIGHVAIFERLCQLHNVNAATADVLMQIYKKKAMPEMEVWCQDLAKTLTDPSCADDFLVLSHTLSGNNTTDAQSILSKFSTKASADKTIVQAVDELVVLATHAQAIGMSISVDMAELSGYHYHTGIVFNAYLNNAQAAQTQALARGGRFNGVSVDATPRAATGFSMDINRLLEFVELVEDTVILVDFADLQQANIVQKADLAAQIKTLQSEGCIVIKPLSHDDRPAQIDGILHLDTDGDDVVWAVQFVGE